MRRGLGLAGPLALSLIVFSAGTIAYYQFIYIATVSQELQFPKEWLEPADEVVVEIIEGSSNINQADNFLPSEVTLTLGLNNRIVWKNVDPVLHTVTADPGSPEPGFAELASRSNFIDQNEEFKFTFLAPGEYKYHCEPHPWMRGTVTVLEPAGA